MLPCGALLRRSLKGLGTDSLGALCAGARPGEGLRRVAPGDPLRAAHLDWFFIPGMGGQSSTFQSRVERDSDEERLGP